MNARAITIEIIPCVNTVVGAPIFCDTAPINKLPSGIIPKIAINKMPITRPLISGADSD